MSGAPSPASKGRHYRHSVYHNPDQTVGAAAYRRLGQCGTKYRGGRFVRRCYADLDTRGAGAYRGRTHTVDRENGQ
jgi:hypothetical protein